MAPEVYRPSETDRRPLKSRSWKASGVVSRWLARQGASANAISVAGMVAGILGGVAFALTPHLSIPALAWLAGAILVQARLAANLLDGMVAIESGRASRLGELYNEVPDRVSDAATLIGLGYAAGGIPWLGYLAAVMALFVAYVRSAARNAGAPQDYSGPMAKPHRMFAVTVTAILCAVVSPWQSLALLGHGHAQAQGAGLPALMLGLIVVGSVVTAIRRLGHAASFLTAQPAGPSDSERESTS
ncbi:Phosphatidylglycerophosphate synthase [Singulisphaera sp. GP187]|uniref:CDP-alcohol phosphatidyltransferase family protein n=1 Tax=Singulisphaera sp. GP187 TaxID=1882752 RepID=UPI00092A585F|nr:CDP-alcohol phosphatidyltransferase family protein [Singulisphaera sp. GP187]SIO27077.1 Phosphatidylglycerophosphate synthase [Singulisphaera sp. GP187]